MTTRVQRRRGTAAEHAAFTGAVGEITVDTTNNRAIVHDGTTAGGIAAAKYSEVVLTASLAAGVAAWFATPSSVNLKAAITDETGSGALVFANSPALVTPALGTPSSGVLTNCTGLPVSTGISGFGTGIAAALGINVGSAGAPVLFNGALGTPSSGTLTNATGLPISTGVSGLGAGVAAFLATPSSANLRSALTDEEGTGAAYFVGGALGTPASATLTNAIGLPVSTGVAGLGTGVATALATNVGSAGAPVVLGGALGTPSSGTLTNATGLPISTGVAGLGANVATALAIAIGAAGAVARLAAQTFLGKQTFNDQIAFSTLPPEYADDAAAATGGLAVGDVYRTGSALKVRAA
jgi:hypothetical protein